MIILKKVSQETIIENYCDSLWMQKGLSKNTLNAYASDLTQIAKWLKDNTKDFFSNPKSERTKLFLSQIL